jgi:hypothetical protein
MRAWNHELAAVANIWLKSQIPIAVSLFCPFFLSRTASLKPSRALLSPSFCFLGSPSRDSAPWVRSLRSPESVPGSIVWPKTAKRSFKSQRHPGLMTRATARMTSGRTPYIEARYCLNRKEGRLKPTLSADGSGENRHPSTCIGSPNLLVGMRLPRELIHM